MDFVPRPLDQRTRKVMRYSGILKMLLAVVVVGCLGFLLHNEIVIDKCLDGGGRWNKVANQCEYGP